MIGHTLPPMSLRTSTISTYVRRDKDDGSGLGHGYLSVSEWVTDASARSVASGTGLSTSRCNLSTRSSARRRSSSR